MSLIFLTGNQIKLGMARRELEPLGIEVTNKDLDTPEIQSMDVEEVAKFSAKYGGDQLQADVMVTDVGYYIPALNGFPGPFIKYVNQTLTPQDLLNLMADHDDRTIVIKECLAYCPHGGEPMTFTATQTGQIIREPRGEGTPINTVVKLDGFDRTVAEVPLDELLDYWFEDLSHYKELGAYLSQQQEAA